MKNTNTALALFVLSGASLIFPNHSKATLLFQENFETYTAGTRPSVFDEVRPTPANQIELTDPDPLGFGVVDGFDGGNGLRIWDYNDAAQALFEKNFAPDGETQQQAVRLDFRFQNTGSATGNTVSNSLIVGLGAFDSAMSMTNFRNRALDLRIMNDGTLRMRAGTPGTAGDGGTYTSITAYNSGAINALSIFANSGLAGFSYSGPDDTERTLAAKTLDVFLNGSLVASGLELQGTLYHTEENVLGKIGFVTGDALLREEIDFIVDDIRVSAIPEPSTYALLLGMVILGAAGGTRRFRKQSA